MPTTFFPSLTYSIPPLENNFHRAFTLRNPEGPHGGCSAKECKTHSKSTDAEYWCGGQENKRNFRFRALFLLLAGGRIKLSPHQRICGRASGAVQQFRWLAKTVCWGRRSIGAPR